MVSASYVALCLMAFALHGAVARPDDKINEAIGKLIPILGQCGKENGDITLDAIKEFRAANKPADDSVACFLACVYKKIGVINEQGVYLSEVAAAKGSKFANPEDIGKVQQATKTCENVNAEAVSDGAKGCDRAKLLHNCFREQKQALHLVF